MFSQCSIGSVREAYSVGNTKPPPAQTVGATTALESSVTAPLEASRRPLLEAPVLKLMLWPARMFHCIASVVSTVTLSLATNSKLYAKAEPINTPFDMGSTVKLDDTMKTNCALGSPLPSNVSVPVSRAVEVKK